MKRSTIVSLLCILFLFYTIFFVGCEKKTTAQKITLYTYLDRSDKRLSENWDRVLGSFKSAYPEIELQIEYGFNVPFSNRLQVLTAADLLPDIVLLWPDKKTAMVTNTGKVKDLRKLIEGHEAEFRTTALAPQGPAGEIWELPDQVIASHIMYTNTRLLKALGLAFPKTITELIGQGAKIRAKGLIPIAMDNKEGWEVQRCLLSMLVERIAGKEWLDKAIKGNARFTDQEFIRACKTIKDLADARMFSPDINQSEYGAALGDFTNEKAVYMIDGSWQVENLVSRLAGEQKKYISLEMFPAIQGEKNPGTTSIVSGTGYAINAKLPDGKAALAWKWIWFYTGPAGSQIRLANGEVPSYKVDTKDADLIVKKLITYIDGATDGYILDSVMDPAGIDTSLQPLLKDMLSGEKSAADVGREYEAWVSAYDSSRKKK